MYKQTTAKGPLLVHGTNYINTLYLTRLSLCTLPYCTFGEDEFDTSEYKCIQRGEKKASNLLLYSGEYQCQVLHDGWSERKKEEEKREERRRPDEMDEE